MPVFLFLLAVGICVNEIHVFLYIQMSFSVVYIFENTNYLFRPSSQRVQTFLTKENKYKKKNLSFDVLFFFP